MIRIPLTLFMGINDPIFCGSHIKRLFSTSVAILPAGLVQRITCDRICTNNRLSCYGHMEQLQPYDGLLIT